VSGGISPTFFSGANATLVADSALLASQGQNGMVTFQYGTLTLTGSSPTINYFNVTAAELASTYTFNIKAPAGSTVIVNVSGNSSNSVSFGNAGMNLQGGLTEDKLLFNFNGVTSINLSNTNLLGSILAPTATLDGTNGHTDGNVMVAAIGQTSSFEYHDTALFDGATPTIATPEPSSAAIAVVGALGMGMYLRRRRKTGSMVSA
jgi:choice-of-anchor A domain-containing protein